MSKVTKFYDLRYYRHLVLSSIDNELKRLNEVFEKRLKELDLNININHGSSDIFYRVLNYDSTERYVDADRVASLRLLPVKDIFMLYDVSSHISLLASMRNDISAFSREVSKDGVISMIVDFYDTMSLIDKTSKNILL